MSASRAEYAVVVYDTEEGMYSAWDVELRRESSATVDPWTHVLLRDLLYARSAR